MEAIDTREALNKANYYLMMAASEDDIRKADMYIRIAQTYVEVAMAAEDLDE